MNMRNLVRRSLLCGTVVCGLGATGQAMADSRHFDLPAEPAVKSIPLFAMQAGIQIIAPVDQLAGIDTLLVKGDFERNQALKHLLRGTPLVIASDDGKTVVLRLAAANTAATPRGSETAANGDGDNFESVVVTAEKREQPVNRVPMSITVASGDELRNSGITQLKDLGLITPGFSYADSYVGSPILTMRGVGFSDISLGGRPTVSTYSDEAPIPFAIETRGTTLDLDRVEVLKGPQGTLFGQNSTGGAINYIAAKPTQTFKAGVDASYGNFNALDIAGFVSGPLSDTVSARVAVNRTENDPWQKSYTSGANNGAGDFTSGRISLAWTPTERLVVQTSVNGWVDASEMQASQLQAVTPKSTGATALIPGLLTYPVAPQNATAADFNTGLDYHKNNNFLQANVRADYLLTERLTLTSLSSYSQYVEHQLADEDGTALINLHEYTRGHITSWFEELRLSGEFGDGSHFVIGANYAHDSVYQRNNTMFPQGTTGLTFMPLGLPVFSDFDNFSDQREDTYAGFADIDYKLTDRLIVAAGARYTEADNRFQGCSADSGDGIAASDLGPFQNYVRSQYGLPPNPPIAKGACFTANALYVPGLVTNTLDESNVSWRAGVQWTPLEKTMLYANVSRGYKAGGFPDLGALNAAQYQPAKQESVQAYEAGFKSTMADDSVQLNGAVFYYDYSDKQILGAVLDPVFGSLFKLVNVPKSQIKGAELQFDWVPLTGLTISGGGTYIASEILGGFSNYNAFGAVQSFNHETFPNTPSWQLVSAADYRWALTDNLDGFVGGNVSYRSSAFSQLGEQAPLALKGYALVNLRAGVESQDGQWRASIWGRNVGDVYYWTVAMHTTDVNTRLAGMPATYGVDLAYRLN